MALCISRKQGENVAINNLRLLNALLKSGGRTYVRQLTTSYVAQDPISTTSLIKLLEASRTSSFRTSLMR